MELDSTAPLKLGWDLFLGMLGLGLSKSPWLHGSQGAHWARPTILCVCVCVCVCVCLHACAHGMKMGKQRVYLWAS